jgi:hypothetical protein
MGMAGRPPKFKKGAMTAAERMRRYRKRRKDIKEATDTTLRQARNERKRSIRNLNPIAQWRAAARNAELRAQVLEERLRLYEQAPLDLDRRGAAAEELARQIAECVMASPGLTIADIRAAIDRRFGSAPSS